MGSLANSRLLFVCLLACLFVCLKRLVRNLMVLYTHPCWCLSTRPYPRPLPGPSHDKLGGTFVYILSLLSISNLFQNNYLSFSVDKYLLDRKTPHLSTMRPPRCFSQKASCAWRKRNRKIWLSREAPIVDKQMKLF